MLRPRVYEFVRATIPAREAIKAEGNSLTAVGDLIYDAIIEKPPRDPRVIPVLLGNQDGPPDLALRLEIEPPYPGEFKASWDMIGDWTACPECGAALVWCEAGFVPGFIMWFWADQLGEEATPEIVQREYDESFARGVACNNSSCWCRKFIKLSKRGVSL